MLEVRLTLPPNITIVLISTFWHHRLTHMICPMKWSRFTAQSKDSSPYCTKTWRWELGRNREGGRLRVIRSWICMNHDPDSWKGQNYPRFHKAPTSVHCSPFTIRHIHRSSQEQIVLRLRMLTTVAVALFWPVCRSFNIECQAERPKSRKESG